MPVVLTYSILGRTTIRQISSRPVVRYFSGAALQLLLRVVNIDCVGAHPLSFLAFSLTTSELILANYFL